MSKVLLIGVFAVAVLALALGGWAIEGTRRLLSSRRQSFRRLQPT
jgi:hypothetical protein